METTVIVTAQNLPMKKKQKIRKKLCLNLDLDLDENVMKNFFMKNAHLRYKNDYLKYLNEHLHMRNEIIRNIFTAPKRIYLYGIEICFALRATTHTFEQYEQTFIDSFDSH